MMDVCARLVAVLLLVCLAAGGCTVSRNIVDIEPPPQPSLQQLEAHLDYVDPDDGRSDYIFYASEAP